MVKHDNYPVITIYLVYNSITGTYSVIKFNQQRDSGNKNQNIKANEQQPYINLKQMKITDEKQQVKLALKISCKTVENDNEKL